MAENIEKIFFRMVDLSTGKVESELIMNNKPNENIFETISRGEYPSIIPFLKNPTIVMKMYHYCSIGEFMERKTGEITKKDNRYKVLDKILSGAGL